MSHVEEEKGKKTCEVGGHLLRRKEIMTLMNGKMFGTSGRRSPGARVIISSKTQCS